MHCTKHSNNKAYQQKEKYKDVYNALASNVWYFNGGSDTTLNRISFTDSGAVIGQVYFDGNGKHENESRDVQVSVDDSNINLIFEDESVAGIPYTLEEDSITLEGGYFTAEEIEEQIQVVMASIIITVHMKANTR